MTTVPTPYAVTAHADRHQRVERLLEAGLDPDEVALRVGISMPAARRIADQRDREQRYREWKDSA